MRKAWYLLLLVCLALACKKATTDSPLDSCNLAETKTINSGKVSITSGVWGTVSHRQGNCMPTASKQGTTCLECPMQSQVRIYAYTTFQNAKPATSGSPYFDSFSTTLFKTVNTDTQGFFQAQLPDGKYTIALVQQGKLYASMFDGQGGVWPLNVQQGKVNMNLVLDQAVY